MKKLMEMIFFKKQKEGSELSIGSSFSEGRVHPVHGTVRAHKGTDLNLKNEDDLNAELLAIGPGKVVWLDWMRGYGNLLVIEYTNIKNEKINILYAHLNGYHDKVKLGSLVKKGDTVGYCGNTGIGTGSHLHLEVIPGKYTGNSAAKRYNPEEFDFSWFDNTEIQTEKNDVKSKTNSNSKFANFKPINDDKYKELRERAVNTKGREIRYLVEILGNDCSRFLKPKIEGYNFEIGFALNLIKYNFENLKLILEKANKKLKDKKDHFEYHEESIKNLLNEIQRKTVKESGEEIKKLESLFVLPSEKYCSALYEAETEFVEENLTAVLKEKGAYSDRLNKSEEKIALISVFSKKHDTLFQEISEELYKYLNARDEFEAGKIRAELWYKLKKNDTEFDDGFTESELFGLNIERYEVENKFSAGVLDYFAHNDDFERHPSVVLEILPNLLEFINSVSEDSSLVSKYQSIINKTEHMVNLILSFYDKIEENDKYFYSYLILKSLSTALSAKDFSKTLWGTITNTLDKLLEKALEEIPPYNAGKLTDSQGKLLFNSTIIDNLKKLMETNKYDIMTKNNLSGVLFNFLTSFEKETDKYDEAEIKKISSGNTQISSGEKIDKGFIKDIKTIIINLGEIHKSVSTNATMTGNPGYMSYIFGKYHDGKIYNQGKSVIHHNSGMRAHVIIDGKVIGTNLKADGNKKYSEDVSGMNVKYELKKSNYIEGDEDLLIKCKAYVIVVAGYKNGMVDIDLPDEKNERSKEKQEDTKNEKANSDAHKDKEKDKNEKQTKEEKEKSESTKIHLTKATGASTASSAISIKPDSAQTMFKAVTAGAQISCILGTIPSVLNVIKPAPTIDGKMIVTMNDIQLPNLGTFGMCTPYYGKPCMPVPCGPWSPILPGVMVGGAPAITDMSMLFCAMGGMIRIGAPGQVGVGMGMPVPSVDFMMAQHNDKVAEYQIKQKEYKEGKNNGKEEKESEDKDKEAQNENRGNTKGVVKKEEAKKDPVPKEKMSLPSWIEVAKQPLNGILHIEAVTPKGDVVHGAPFTIEDKVGKILASGNLDKKGKALAVGLPVNQEVIVKVGEDTREYKSFGVVKELKAILDNIVNFGEDENSNNISKLSDEKTENDKAAWQSLILNSIEADNSLGKMLKELVKGTVVNSSTEEIYKKLRGVGSGNPESILKNIKWSQLKTETHLKLEKIINEAIKVQNVKLNNEESQEKKKEITKKISNMEKLKGKSVSEIGKLLDEAKAKTEKMIAEEKKLYNKVSIKTSSSDNLLKKDEKKVVAKVKQEAIVEKIVKKESNKKILTLENLRDELRDKALKITAGFEGGGFDNVTGNFDGQGLSLGILQWNIGKGTLQPLLNEYFERNESQAKTILDSEFNKVKEMLTKSRSEQMKWAISINEEIFNKKNKRIIIIKEDWSKKLKEICNTDEYRKIQIKATKEYIKQACNIVNRFELKTENGYCLAFDIAVQNWDVRKEDADNIVSNMKKLEEKQKLELIKDAVVKKAREDFRLDVKNRKETIIYGSGKVHGKNFDLSKEYNLNNHEIF